MSKMQFKSTIKCSGCVANVTPHLHEVSGLEKWEVDLKSPDRILSVEGDLTEEQVREAVQKAGYTVEKI